MLITSILLPIYTNKIMSLLYKLVEEFRMVIQNGVRCFETPDILIADL
jgi:hypothetical protein